MKTTGWQHRFFDLTILSPIWLGTYEYMKNTLKIFFFWFETGLPDLDFFFSNLKNPPVVFASLSLLKCLCLKGKVEETMQPY